MSGGADMVATPRELEICSRATGAPAYAWLPVSRNTCRPVRHYGDPVDLAAFDALAEPFLRKAAELAARDGFTSVDGRTCTADEIARVEDRMGVTFPEPYKAFMTRYGGGMFGLKSSTDRALERRSP
jgi:hypothetical protein